MSIQERTLKLFHDLMALDTINPPGNEKRAADYLREVFTEAGIPCEVQDLGDNRANLIAECGSGDPVLEFCGHLDVVPYADEWKHPPVCATEENGLIYGRGACDMKGGVAAMCAAALTLHAQGLPRKGTLRLTFVADEEHANLGMHAYLRTHKPADWAVIGEPTDLQVAVAHRGVARYYVDLHGPASHAALPAPRDTAISLAARSVLAFEEMNKALAKETHEVLPPPSIVITQMQGYEKDNVIPSHVRLLTDYRLLPGTSEEQAKKRIEETLVQSGITNFTLEKRFCMPGGAISSQDPFVSQCLDVMGQMTGKQLKARAFDASCEQCFLLEKGVRTVICGPGGLSQAHTTDEFIPRDQLLLAAECYRALAMEMLKEDE